MVTKVDLHVFECLVVFLCDWMDQSCFLVHRRNESVALIWQDVKQFIFSVIIM
jgi:hypothetical protein